MCIISEPTAAVKRGLTIERVTEQYSTHAVSDPLE